MKEIEDIDEAQKDADKLVELGEQDGPELDPFIQALQSSDKKSCISPGKTTENIESLIPSIEGSIIDHQISESKLDIDLDDLVGELGE